ncbi:MAG: MFS transporter [Candidatus Latescibacteria bacterium]|nr:MFS transporter [Candidatus Latescibacterota bacterium]
MSTSIFEERTSPVSLDDRYNRRNFGALLIDFIGYFTGQTFISPSTILPLFVHQLTTSNVLIGLIPTIFTLGASLPSPLLARFIERLPLKRNYILWLAAVERLPWMAMVLLTLAIGQSVPTLLLILFFLSLTINAFSLGCGIPAYSAMMQKIIPVNRRGRLYGIGGGVAGLLSIPGAWYVEEILNRYGFPSGFAYCFLIAFLLLTVSAAFIILVREPVYSPISSPSDRRSYMHRARSILKANPSFVFFNFSQILYAFNGMAVAFYTVYAIVHLHAQPGDIALFTGVLMGTNAVANPLWGYLADHRGNRRVMLWASVCGLASPAVALTSGSLYSFAIVFALNEFARAGLELSRFNIVMEFSPPGEVPTYVALKYLLTAPFLAVAPLLGGIIADRWGYIPVFYLAIAGTASSLLFIAQMHEPRERTR